MKNVQVAAVSMGRFGHRIMISVVVKEYNTNEKNERSRDKTPITKREYGYAPVVNNNHVTNVANASSDVSGSLNQVYTSNILK